MANFLNLSNATRDYGDSQNIQINVLFPEEGRVYEGPVEYLLDPTSPAFKTSLLNLSEIVQNEEVQNITCTISYGKGLEESFTSIVDPELLNRIQRAVTVVFHPATSLPDAPAIDLEGQKEIYDLFANSIFTSVAPVLEPRLEEIEQIRDIVLSNIVLGAYAATGNKHITYTLLSQMTGISEEDAKVLVDYWAQNLVPTIPGLMGLSEGDQHKFRKEHREFLDHVLKAIEDPSSVKGGWKKTNWFKFLMATAPSALRFIKANPKLNVAMTEMLKHFKGKISGDSELSQGFAEFYKDFRENFSESEELFRIMKTELETFGEEAVAEASKLLSTPEGESFFSAVFGNYSEIRKLTSTDRVVSDDEPAEQLGSHLSGAVVDHFIHDPESFHNMVTFAGNSPWLLKTVEEAMPLVKEETETFRNLIQTGDNLAKADPKFIGEVLEDAMTLARYIGQDKTELFLQRLLDPRLKWGRGFIAAKAKELTSDPARAKMLIDFYRHNKPHLATVVEKGPEACEQVIHNFNKAFLPEELVDVRGDYAKASTPAPSTPKVEVSDEVPEHQDVRVMPRTKPTLRSLLFGRRSVPSHIAAARQTMRQDLHLRDVRPLRRYTGE